MIITLCKPLTVDEFVSYYHFRWKILRKPWNQPKGSERDGKDKTSIHRMIIEESTNQIIAVGRLHFNTKKEAQIRYMAVADGYQGQGLGSKILRALEKIALEQGVRWIILQARWNAVQFYKNNGYEIVKKSYILFGEIQHWLMRKAYER